MRMLTSLPPTDRRTRSPRHRFNNRFLPYTLAPFMIAPVLPTETMKNVYFETRVITDPIRNPIIGWKLEYHFFYVKVTDLLTDSIRDMFIDPTNTDLSATLGIAANSQAWYEAKGGVDYLARCTKRVWQEYFSDQDDDYATYQVSGVDASVNGYPIVQIRDRSWLDSITDDDAMPDGVDPNTATSAEQLLQLQAAYQQLQAMSIANMTFEDFLRSYGINVPGQQEDKPELLASFSEFQYPSNTVDPATGTPTSACSWVFKNSARDPKNFKQPGFIVGYVVARPKVYMSGLAGGLHAHLTRAWDWLPNYMNEDAANPMPFTAIKKFLPDTGPLGDRTTATDDYYVDMRDLFLYGDQFQNVNAFNVVPADVSAQHMLALPPGNDHQKWKYLTPAQCKSFFVDSAGSAFYVRQDGYCNLDIVGHQVDFTNGNLAEV